MNVRQSAAAVFFCACLSWAAPAAADVVTDWDAIAVQAIVSAGALRPSGTGILDWAMVHVAVHDAVQSYQKRFEPFLELVPGASGSPAAAVAAAAHDILVHQFPAQASSLTTTYQNYLTTHGLLNDAGLSVGQQAAAAIIHARANDGSFPVPNQPNEPSFSGGQNPGEWRPTLPAFATMAAPWLGDVTPFALKDSSQLRPNPPPPALTSGEYTHAFNESKALGAKFNSARTPEQTELALFWATNYLPTWSGAMRDIASANLSDIGDTARLFALTAVASADAIICAWNTKKYYNFWRPITAIQLGDADGNPHTVGDSEWLPLVNTPNYPDYTSGANNFTSAVTRSLAMFFNTDSMTYSVTWVTTGNPSPTNTTRTYYSFSDAMDDVVDARVMEGIHFRFADTVARRTGKRAADWAFSHVMRPTGS
jgi:hypothetical protein